MTLFCRERRLLVLLQSIINQFRLAEFLFLLFKSYLHPWLREFERIGLNKIEWERGRYRENEKEIGENEGFWNP